jgi:glutathione S-transferase
VPHAIERYQTEMGRLFGVAETRLGETKYLAGDEYSIADIATFGWFNTHEMQGAVARRITQCAPLAGRFTRAARRAARARRVGRKCPPALTRRPNNIKRREQ